MVNLQDLLLQTLAMPHVLRYKLEREYDADTINAVRVYKFWMKPTTRIYEQTQNILVRNLGTPQEDAQFFSDSFLSVNSQPFKDEVETAIVDYITTHSELEQWSWEQCEEANERGVITAWELDANSELMKKQYMIFKKNGQLQFRKLNQIYFGENTP